MARRKLTAKQIAAGFGGKRRKAASKTRRRKAVKRTTSKKVRPMARRKTSRKTARRRSSSKTFITLGTALPALKIAGETLFGRKAGGVQLGGAIPALKAGGPIRAAQEAGNILALQLTGAHPGFGQGGYKGFQPKLLMENAGFYVAGKVAHKAAGKVGLNRMLSRFGSPVKV